MKSGGVFGLTVGLATLKKEYILNSILPICFLNTLQARNTPTYEKRLPIMMRMYESFV